MAIPSYLLFLLLSSVVLYTKGASVPLCAGLIPNANILILEDCELLAGNYEFTTFTVSNGISLLFLFSNRIHLNSPHSYSHNHHTIHYSVATHTSYSSHANLLYFSHLRIAGIIVHYNASYGLTIRANVFQMDSNSIIILEV
jgi:hypothetical protein